MTTGRVVPVGLLTSYVKELLDSDDLLADLWVEGEVSNVFRAQSGHVYFTMKDTDSQIKCALFRSHAVRQRWLPEAGDQVAAHGRVSVYERDGAYQLYVDVVQPAGVGILALQLEQLRQRLEAEGLFDQSRKRLLPAAPRAIGLVTSPDGAVWHDIQNVLRRRYPFTELILAPATVQGERAPATIVAAIEALQAVPEVEVIVVARGGGSIEDLWAFNDERVARAAFACRVPVVSGVGHETDWTIIDDVADLRAPTPSAAAELCVPSITDIADRLVDLHRRHYACAAETLSSHATDVAHARRHLHRLSARHQIKTQRELVNGRTTRLRTARQTTLDAERSRFATRQALLRALEPSAVLRRGYAVLSDAETDEPICELTQAAPGMLAHAQLLDGTVVARVEAVRPVASEMGVTR